MENARGVRKVCVYYGACVLCSIDSSPCSNAVKQAHTYIIHSRAKCSLQSRHQTTCCLHYDCTRLLLKFYPPHCVPAAGCWWRPVQLCARMTHNKTVCPYVARRVGVQLKRIAHIVGPSHASVRVRRDSERCVRACKTEIGAGIPFTRARMSCL